MKAFLRFFILFWIFPALLPAQNDPDAGTSLQQLEKEFASMANIILNDTSYRTKFDLNKQFSQRFINALKRPESFDYKWDSLKTISILRPEDNSFRIFTWYLTDRTGEGFYNEAAHYHFGLVQRKYTTRSGKEMILVIPLFELEQIPKGFETIVTDNLQWFGALYYQPKHMTYIPSYDGFYYKLVPRDKNEIVKSDKPAAVLTYSPGKYRGRYVKETAGVELRTHKRVKQEVRYYELMGWNGWNNKADYKVFEIMSFDPDDSMRVIFGAPIIHFEKIPKSRAMFKYSEYASFSLNSGFVRRGPLGIVRKKMFVFDHLAPPMHSKPTEVFELGPDGTFDALKFSKHYGGYFEVYQNIEPDFAYGAEQERKHRQEVFELQKKTLSDSLVEESFKLSRSDARASMREFRKQRKEEEKRMKAQGIDLKAKKEEEPK